MQLVLMHFEISSETKNYASDNSNFDCIYDNHENCCCKTVFYFTQLLVHWLIRAGDCMMIIMLTLR